MFCFPLLLQRPIFLFSHSSYSFFNYIVSCGCLRMARVGVADRLADPQREQSLVAGVSQGVDRLGEHAS